MIQVFWLFSSQKGGVRDRIHSDVYLTEVLETLLLPANLTMMSFPRFNATGLTKYQILTRIFIQVLLRLDTLFAANEFIFTRVDAIRFDQKLTHNL
jgi:hypothetical protein